MARPNAADLVMLPWTIKGPWKLTDASGTRYEMRVMELPDFLWAAPSESAALYGFKKALRAHLEIALTAGRMVPQPQGRPIIYSTPAVKRGVVGGLLGIQSITLQV